MFFHSFLLTSKLYFRNTFLQVPTWLLALAILVAADLLDSTLDQELWIRPGQHATVTASNFC